ncbi:PAS domain-containing protein, partial [Methylobacterium frigidaeris]
MKRQREGYLGVIRCCLTFTFLDDRDTEHAVRISLVKLRRLCDEVFPVHTNRKIIQCMTSMTHAIHHGQGIDHEDNVFRSDTSLFKAALDSIGEAVVVTSSQLSWPGPIIEYVNEVFCLMTGYSAGEIIGSTPRILQGPLTNRAVLDRLRSDLEAREYFQGAAINYRKDGTTYLLHWHITPLR